MFNDVAFFSLAHCLALLCIIVKIELLSEFITYLDRYLDVLYSKAELAFGFYFAQVGTGWVG